MVTSQTCSFLNDSSLVDVWNARLEQSNEKSIASITMSSKRVRLFHMCNLKITNEDVVLLLRVFKKGAPYSSKVNSYEGMYHRMVRTKNFPIFRTVLYRIKTDIF